jgi:hypothetical protein
LVRESDGGAGIVGQQSGLRATPESPH